MLALMFGSGGEPSPCPGAYEVAAATHAYGADADLQALDLYLPRGAHSPPLIVYIHGGAWVSRDKSEYRELGAAFARCGIAAAVINYRLAPEVQVGQQVDDVASALRRLTERASNLVFRASSTNSDVGYDLRRIFLIGHSAGAQLALYALVSGALKRGSIAGVVALGSVGINPSSDVAELDPRYQGIYEPAFGADRAAWRKFDIKTLLRGNEPPVLVVHGVNDSMAPEAISRQLYQQLRAAGDRVRYEQPADRDHWSMLDHMTQPEDPTMQAIERFVLGK